MLRYMFFSVGVTCLLICGGTLLYYILDVEKMYYNYIQDRDRVSFVNLSEQESFNLDKIYASASDDVSVKVIKEELNASDDAGEKIKKELELRKKEFKSYVKSRVEDDVGAIIQIERIGLNELVYNGPATHENLKKGVTFLEKDVDLNRQNISIAGHRVEGGGIQFNVLEDAKIGDEVKLQFKDHTRVYVLTKISHVPPKAVNITSDFDDVDRITLITCDDYNPETGVFETRAIFIAEFVDVIL